MISMLLALMVNLAGAAGQLQAAASQPADAGMRLAVMTFNIRLGVAKDGENDWQHRQGILFDVLRKYKPDLVGLQEAFDFQIDAIRKAVPGYAEIGVGREDGKSKGEYSGILYCEKRLKLLDSGTFWLSETPEVPGSKSWKTACTRVCTWGRFEDRASGRRFYHYNTHLDHISQEARERGIELIVSRMEQRKNDDPIFLTGDFNAGEDNSAVHYLKGDLPRASKGEGKVAPSPHLLDTYRVLHADAKESGTFNSWKGETTGDKIDYIFVPRSVFRVISAEILHDNREGRYPSDHFPLMSVVEWAKPANKAAQ